MTKVTITTDIPAIAENIVSLLKINFFKHLKATACARCVDGTNHIIDVLAPSKNFPAVSSYIVAVFEDFKMEPPENIVRGYNQAKKDLRNRK